MTIPIAYVLTWGGLALLGYLVYLVIAPFFIPLGWAAVLAIVFFPLHSRLAARWGPGPGAAATTVTATVALIVPLLLVSLAFVREALDAAAYVQQAFLDRRFSWIERAWNELQRRVPAAQDVTLGALASEAMKNAATLLVARSSLVLRNTGLFLLNLVITLFATFFLLRDSPAIMRTIRRLIPMADAPREQMLRTTRELIWVGVTSAGIVAAVQGILGGLAFAAVGLPAPVFWGGMMGFLCLLPFGAWVVWAPAALLLAASGEMARALILAAIGVAIVSAADNLLRPMLLAGRAHINGLVIFVSLLGGIAAFGAIGLVLGPVLIVTALGLVAGYVSAVERTLAEAEGDAPEPERRRDSHQT